MVTTSKNTKENIERLAKSMGKVELNDSINDEEIDVYDLLQHVIQGILSIKKYGFDCNSRIRCSFQFYDSLNAAAHHLLNANHELSKSVRAAQDSEEN